MYNLGIRHDDLVLADTGNGGDLRISEIRRLYRQYPELRFNIRPVIKGPGSIKFGINRLQEHSVYMTEGSSDGWHEYQEYKWGLDADGNPTDQPVDKDNHIMDCARYFALAKGTLF